MMLKRDKGISLLIVVLVVIPLLASVAIPQNPGYNLRCFNLSDPARSSQGYETNLSLECIIGGIGLTGTVKNNGKIDLKNISIAINISKESLVQLKTTSIIIPCIVSNESTKFRVFLFGFNLGRLRTPSEITITISTSENNRKEVRVVPLVFGVFTKIITIHFIDDAFDGYALFSPEYSKNTFLIEKQGNIVHTWESNYIQGLGLLLLENGYLLRTALLFNNPVFSAGGVTGGVELFDWNGTRIWQYNYSNNQHCLHHDIEILPNGHVLMVSWEYKTAEEAIAAGRNPDSLPTGSLWPDHIIEVKRTGPYEGTIVWEWHIWDHLIQDFDPTKDNYGNIAEHPELLDINYGIEEGKQRADWNHINSIDYNEEFDQILLSARHQHEIWVIDHSTTTEQAAGHSGGRSGKGGDLLYRWGNPEIYGAGDKSDQRLFGQHDAQWIPEGYPGQGNILVFNNGQGRPEGRYSSVDELLPPVDENGLYYLAPGCAFGPEQLVWSYTAENPLDFYAGFLSSAQRLPNGNTLICDGDHGRFFEVTKEKKTVWKYFNTIPPPPANQVFMLLCFASDYPGLQFLK